ncbi:nucleotidyl transferase AbiEii/AbiGii toxin family protein [Arhodomonas sp. SL1]|uniref:nucleotidyl transferase AbiEii/AbiGii toxin family protein n=1 Tax=Arhodomonas sp. SL1 TaxID=3425691 RepID=UPI003F8816C0
MPFSETYRRQVELLIRTLPLVAEEECFALKGGTAINLFIRNLPRLSVDIDLTYLPIADRQSSLAAIDAALRRIAARVQNANPRITVTESAPRSQSAINKLVLRTPGRVQIKIEVTPVLRGCVYPSQNMVVSETVEDQFGFAEISVLSFPDLYAGKITAALDRQHPRDLFDVYHLLRNEGITQELRAALIVYLISHDHPPHALLSNACRDITHDFTHNFQGMADEDVASEVLTETHRELVRDIVGNMPDHHRRFLLSFYRRAPDWSLLGIEGLDRLPAVRWREFNLDKAGKDTQADIVRKLEQVLGATDT